MLSICFNPFLFLVKECSVVSDLLFRVISIMSFFAIVYKYLSFLRAFAF